MNATTELTQLNARIPKALKRSLKTVAAHTGLKIEVIALDAFRWYYGIPDEQTQQRRKVFSAALKQLNEGPARPFN